MFVMLALGIWVWRSEKREKEHPSAASGPAPVRASKVDLSTLSPGDSVPEWSPSQGSFRMTTVNGRNVLELGFEPLVEGRLVRSRLLANTGVVRARMWGERTRRNAPRFAVGLTASASYWFRVIPLERTLQLVGKEEKVLASLPWEGSPEQPMWIELKFVPRQGAPGSRLEGRVWREGDPRPEAASLSTEVEETIGFARVVVAGAPYALKPILIDRLEAAVNEAMD